MTERRMQGEQAETQGRSGRGLTGRVILTLAIMAVVPLALLAFVLWDVSEHLDDAGSGQPEAAAVVRWRDDPGMVYDRAVVTPRTTPSPSPSPTPVFVSAEAPPFRNTPFRLQIDRIGVDAPVSEYGLDWQQVPQVPLNAWEVAWYNFSAQPGTGGNAVFAGHVTWSGQAVFYSLNQLASGDTVRLRGDDGTELIYTVTESFMVDPSDPDALSVMGPTDSDTVTIITCDGSFYYTGDPTFRGDYTHRRVVRAALSDAVLPGAAIAAGG